MTSDGSQDDEYSSSTHAAEQIQDFEIGLDDRDRFIDLQNAERTVANFQRCLLDLATWKRGEPELSEVIRTLVFRSPDVVAVQSPNVLAAREQLRGERYARTIGQNAAYNGMFDGTFYLWPLPITASFLHDQFRPVEEAGEDPDRRWGTLSTEIKIAFESIERNSTHLFEVLSTGAVRCCDLNDAPLSKALWLRSGLTIDLTKSDLYDVSLKQWQVGEEPLRRGVRLLPSLNETRPPVIQYKSNPNLAQLEAPGAAVLDADHRPRDKTGAASNQSGGAPRKRWNKIWPEILKIVLSYEEFPPRSVLTLKIKEKIPSSMGTVMKDGFGDLYDFVEPRSAKPRKRKRPSPETMVDFEILRVAGSKAKFPKRSNTLTQTLKKKFPEVDEVYINFRVAEAYKVLDATRIAAR